MKRFGISILVAAALVILTLPQLASAGGAGVRLGAGPFVAVPGHGAVRGGFVVPNQGFVVVPNQGFVVVPNHQFHQFHHFRSPHVSPQFVWQPGFWRWDGFRWAWTPSRWIQVFPGR